MEKVRELISYLIYVWNWKWLERIIAFIGETECKLKNHTYTKWDLGINSVPSGFYCYWGTYTCPFLTSSKFIKFIYGHQCSGYCTLMQKGDFSAEEPTDLLWDACKCCGINDEEDIDEGDIVECNLEL